MSDQVDPVAFGRLEGKVDVMITLLNTKLDNHDKRIGSLERSRSWVLGFAGAVGAVAGYFVSMFTGKP